MPLPAVKRIRTQQVVARIFGGSAAAIRDVRKCLMIACVTCLWFFVCAWSSAPATASEDEAFVEGLRERQLHRLAIDYCNQRLASQALTSREQVELTVELMRTLADLGVQRLGDERETLFARVHEASQRLLDAPQPPSRSILVEVQDALTDLTYGRTTMLERQVGVGNEAARQRALDVLREGIRKLDAIDQFLETEIPKRFRDAGADDALTADQLLGLRQRVKFQRGLATQYRALLFDEDDQLNRIDSLTSVAEEYTGLAQTVPQDNRLWWQVQIEHAHCLRLLGRTSEAGRILNELPKEVPDVLLAARIEVEKMQLDLVAKDAQQALRRGVTWVERGVARLPEIDQGILQAMLVISDGSELTDAERNLWQERAVAMARDIESRHGAFWGRRANLQLVGVSESGGQMENTSILLQVGDEHFLKEQFDDALNAYQKAAEQAKSSQQYDLWMLASRKAGYLLQQQEDFLSASVVLRDVALNLKDHDLAPLVHQQAALALAKVAADDASQIEKYQELLEENISTWPESSESGQTRIWLGKIYEYQSEFGAAVDLYLDVDPGSGVAEEALALAISAADRDLAKAAENDRDVNAVADRLATRFATWVPEDDESWTGVSATAAVATARLRLVYQSADQGAAASVLDRVLALEAPADADWLQNAIALRIIAFAATPNSQARIEELLARLGKSDPSQWMETVEALARMSSESTGNAQIELAGTTLQVIETIQSSSVEFNAQQQLRLARLQATLLREAGQSENAIKALEELLNQNPRNGVVLEELAEVLLESSQASRLEQALGRWRQLARGSRPQTDRWYRAKYNVALSLHRLGRNDDARMLLQFMKETPPGWSDSAMANQFEELLKKCS